MAEFYEPYEKLIRIVVLGREFDVPENNLLLRQLQFVSAEIGMGRYCWNGECRYCEVQYRRNGDKTDTPALACRIKGLPGMRITKLAQEMRYNLSAALAAARKARE
jgi:hypothetical protein